MQAVEQDATRVSARVSELDVAQQRALRLLAATRGQLARENIVEGVRGALSAGNLPAAVEHVRAYREVVGASGGPEDPEVAEVRRELEGALRERMALHVGAGGHEEVVATLGMMRAAGVGEEAAALFCKYVCGLVEERARGDVGALEEAVSRPGLGKTADFARSLTELFRDVGVAIEQNEARLVADLGPGAVERLARGLLAVADAWGSRILRAFMRERGAAVAGAGAGQGDPREIERVAGEVVGMCGQVEEFAAYVVQKERRMRELSDERARPQGEREAGPGLGGVLLRGAVSRSLSSRGLGTPGGAPGGTPGGTPGGAPGGSGAHGWVLSEWGEQEAERAVRAGEMSGAVGELLGSYVGLEASYLERSIETAISIDEPVAGSLTTSLVDDAFFVVLSSCRRALATRSLQPACATISHAISLVSGQVRAALAAALSPGAQRVSLNAPGAVAVMGDEAEREAEVEQHTRAMNNVVTAAAYVATLQQTLRQEGSAAFPKAEDTERLEMVLSDLSKAGSDMVQLSGKAVDNLAAALRSRFVDALEAVQECEYAGEAAEASARTSEWVQQTLAEIETLAGWLGGRLTEELMGALTLAVLGDVARGAEERLRRKRFSLLGGLQLESDVRALTQGASMLCTRSVRDVLARLSQIAGVVSCESVGELRELWSTGGGGGAAPASSWRLSPEEALRWMSQRVDVRPEDIAAVSL